MFRRPSSLSAGKYPVPNLDLNYAVTRALSGIETFTRASTAWGFNSAGTLTQYAANVPRFDYDPAMLTPRGLLVEEQRTNLLLNSNTFSAWSNSNLSVTGSSGIAPTGANEAWLLNATGVEGRAALNITIPADSSVYAYSIHMKPGSAAVTDIRLSFAGGGEFDARVTWATASIAVKKGTHAFTPTLQSIGGGWYRAVMGAANTSRTQVLTYIFPAGQGTSATGTVLAFGAQIESGWFATSYIPTTSSIATRAADVCSVSTSAFGFNAMEGTLFVEALSVSASGNFSYAVIDDGTVTNQLRIATTGASVASFLVQSAGVNQAAFNPAAIAAGTMFKAALAYATDKFGGAVNGAASVSDSSGAIPANLLILRIGARNGNLNTCNSHIRRVAYYPRAFENATLGRITS